MGFLKDAQFLQARSKTGIRPPSGMNPSPIVCDYILKDAPMKRSTYYPLMALSVVGLTGFYAAVLYGLSGRLDLPVYHSYLAGIAVLVLPQVYRSEVFAAPWLLWSGLAPSP